MSADQKSGSEAAVHALNSMFSAGETDAVLLAFNTLNRAAALHNISILCPTIATFVINTYRLPVRLFVTGGQEHNPISTGGRCFPRKFCLPVDNFFSFGSIATKFGEFS